jgi:hypothetical protein
VRGGESAIKAATVYINFRDAGKKGCYYYGWPGVAFSGRISVAGVS